MVISSVSAENLTEFDNHKNVFRFEDRDAGLVAFLAIHNENLGPGTGGTRAWYYSIENDAINDALRLSRAMTYKCALAGVPFGGSKGVIILNSEGKSKRTLEAYARAINSLKRITTGLDVGLTNEDVKYMRKFSSNFLGLAQEGRLDTGKMASLSTFMGILATAERLWGEPSVQGRVFAIKGLGKTGTELARLIAERGGEIIAADINKESLSKIQKEIPGIKIVNPSDVMKQEADIYCPCALNGDLTTDSIKDLRCKAIVGSANNQLANLSVANEIEKIGILYAPDYTVNSGGLINVVDELEPGGYSKQRVLSKIEKVKDTLHRVFHEADKHRITTAQAADQLAESAFRK